MTCYLINGVCHQAANRILVPADITVDGARGYKLSLSIFSLYGRERANSWFCRAPFDSRPHVTGNLPECESTGIIADGPPPAYLIRQDYDFLDPIYMEGVRRIYAASTGEDAVKDEKQLFDEQIELFKLFVAHRFRQAGTRISTPRYHELMRVRERFEEARLAAESVFAESRETEAFVHRFNDLTIQFQKESGEVLDDDEYQVLLDLRRDEHIVLADPDIVPYDHGAEPEPDGRAS